jgi:hypothetical protein
MAHLSSVFAPKREGPWVTGPWSTRSSWLGIVTPSSALALRRDDRGELPRRRRSLLRTLPKLPENEAGRGLGAGARRASWTNVH